MHQIVQSSLIYLESYNEAVCEISAERDYLSTTDGFSLESSAHLLKIVHEQNIPQFFALEGDKVIGWIDLMPRPFKHFAHVGVLGMGVRAQHRGRGLGSLLLKTLLDEAPHRGFEKIELSVYATNLRAIGLYKKFGFEAEGLRQKSRKLDGVYSDEMLMAKFLGPTKYSPP